VTCYATVDTVQIVNWFIYNLTLTIIYSAMSHLHSLNLTRQYSTESYPCLSPAENFPCRAPAENCPRLAPAENCVLLVKVKVSLRLTASQSVSLGVEPSSGAHDQIFFTV
jgi:hypothetical protein